MIDKIICMNFPKNICLIKKELKCKSKEEISQLEIKSVSNWVRLWGKSPRILTMSVLPKRIGQI